MRRPVCVIPWAYQSPPKSVAGRRAFSVRKGVRSATKRGKSNGRTDSTQEVRDVPLVERLAQHPFRRGKPRVRDDQGGSARRQLPRLARQASLQRHGDLLPLVEMGEAVMMQTISMRVHGGTKTTKEKDKKYGIPRCVGQYCLRSCQQGG